MPPEYYLSMGFPTPYAQNNYALYDPPDPSFRDVRGPGSDLLRAYFSDRAALPRINPCPFCRSGNVDVEGPVGVCVVCHSCNAEGPTVGGRHTRHPGLNMSGAVSLAIELWNKAPQPEAVKP